MFKIIVSDLSPTYITMLEQECQAFQGDPKDFMESLGLTGLKKMSERGEVNVYKNNSFAVKRFSVTQDKYLEEAINQIPILKKAFSYYNLSSLINEKCYYKLKISNDQVVKATILLIMNRLEFTLPNYFKHTPEHYNQVMYKLDLAIDCFKAVRAFHIMGYIHREISLENFMIEKREQNGNKKKVGFNPTLIDYKNAFQPNNQDGVVVGNPLYTDPATAEQEVYDFKSDVFSLGVLFYFIMNIKETLGLEELTGQGLGQERLYECESDHTINKLNLFYCYFLKDIPESLMSQDRENRMSIEQAIEAMQTARETIDAAIKEAWGNGNTLEAYPGLNFEGTLNLDEYLVYKYNKYENMFDKTKQTYINFYNPFQERLAELLKRILV